MRRNYPSVLAVLYDIHGEPAGARGGAGGCRGRRARRRSSSAAISSASGPFPARDACPLLREIDEPTMWIRGNGERWMREPPLDRPEIVANLKEHVAQLLGRGGRVAVPPTRARGDRRRRLRPRLLVERRRQLRARAAAEPTSCASGRCTVARSCSGTRTCSSAGAGPKDNELVNPGVGRHAARRRHARSVGDRGTARTSRSTAPSTTSSASSPRRRLRRQWSDVLVHRYRYASD